jgi:hypothetical protein
MFEVNFRQAGFTATCRRHPSQQLDERIGLNASFEAIMGTWLTTSRGFVAMPVMQILNSTSIVTITKYLSRRKD